MKKQLETLTTIFQTFSEEQLPKSSGELYENYIEQSENQVSQATFSERLRKLVEKGLLKNPTYGNYDISQRGKRKAESILKDGDNLELAEDIKQVKKELEDFLFVEKDEDIDNAIINGKKFKVKLSDLDKFNTDLIDYFEENPDKFVEALDLAFENYTEGSNKPRYKLEADVDYFDQSIYTARSSDKSEQVISVTGTIEYSTSPFHEVVKVIYECEDCGDNKSVNVDSSGKVKSPYKCECGNKRFKKVKTEELDVIEFRISNTEGENEKIKGVFKPETLNKKVRNVFRPGKKIRVIGILRNKFKNNRTNKKDPFIEVISYKEEEKNFSLENVESEKREEVIKKIENWDQSGENIFKKIAESIAPSIVGNEGVKKVVSASVIGGAPVKSDGRIHTYIVGNPGTGKTDIQEFIGNVFPNSHYADCSHATEIGLTATVEEEETGYKLKAGKLVFADKGILSLDEFDDVDSKQAKRFNRAMQNGKFNIDKASQHAELPGRATIIATANYKEMLEDNDYILDFLPDLHESVEDRFDLIYCMPPQKDRSEAIDSILSEFSSSSSEKTKAPLTKKELAILRDLAKDLEPKLTKEAKNLLEEWINNEKDIAESKYDRPEFKGDSLRYVVSLAKLTTMFAKTRLSHTAEVRDAKKAIDLFSMCRSSVGGKAGENINQVRKKNTLEEIRNVLDKKIERSDDWVYIDDIISECESDSEQVEKILDKLEAKGEIYEKEPGKIARI